MPDLRKYAGIFKKNKYLLIVLAVGVFLLLLPTGKAEEPMTGTWESLDFSLEEYEEKIEAVLADCTGVGRVKVALAVKGSGSSVYAEEISVNTRKSDDEYTKDSDTKLSVLSVNSGVEEPIVIEKTYPDFLGATVVCDGAEISQVRKDITEAVASLTGLSTDKISIIKMKN